MADIGELLDSVLSVYRSRIAAAGLETLREYRIVPALKCRSGDLRHAISNIVWNALDATNSGGRLRIRMRRAINWRRGVETGIRITIADTGCGIPDDKKELVFEPFYSTKGITGTGLGLWIAREVVTRGGGRIQLKSWTRPGSSGTVVWIFLQAEA